MGRDFPQLSRPALGPTQPPVQWLPDLSRGKERPGRDVDPSPLLVPWLRKSRAIPLLPLWVVRPVQSLSACTRVHFTSYLINGTIFENKSSCVTYRLRDGRSGIESRCGRDFPHLSREALRPTQPPVQWVLGFSGGKKRPGRDADPSPPSRALPLLPLWAVRPVQSLSACTRVHFYFFYYVI